MTKSQVTQLQKDLNRFSDKYLYGVTHLRVDGDLGAATKKRIRFTKYYLGMVQPARLSSAVGPEFLARLAHPKSLKVVGAKGLLYGAHRRSKQRRLARASEAQHRNKIGFGTFDGHTVAAWMIPWLEKSRQHGWRGTVVSGVRTPAYSEHLCIAMCGHPTCPGRCAGRSSNHNMLPNQGKPHGAIDVTFYQDFGRIQHEIGSPLRNALPIDPVHYSVTGR